MAKKSKGKLKNYDRGVFLMKKINDIFANITASEELKKKTYQRILERKYEKQIFIRRRLSIFSYTFASIVIGLFVYNNYNILNDADKIGTLGTEDISITNDVNVHEDSFLYNNNSYVIASDIITLDLLDKKIGALNQVDSEQKLSKNFDSYYHNGASVYTIKNINNKLAIINNDEIIVYIRVNE
jgi:hypothetical protein